VEQPTLPAPGASKPNDEQRIVDIVRVLAAEVGGPRAASAVSPTASLERDLGLGSLERVELLVRLEAGLGRDLADGFLLLDTPREIARALDATAPAADIIPAAVTVAPTAVPARRLDDVATLSDAFATRAELEPRQTHGWLVAAGVDHVVTHGAIWDGALRIARALSARGVRRGDRVAIMLPTGLDFLQAFAGTLAAGAVAVPLYPPARLDRIGEYLERQARILSNADSRILIAMPEAAPVSTVLRDMVPVLSEVVTADALRVAGSDATGVEPATAEPAGADDPALIQYTSGSTGDPRGVVLTHAAILSNIRAIGAAVDVRPTDVIVSWLPLYHDMGLIGAWLSATVWGIPIAMMSPLDFLQSPGRWLRAVDRYRGTLTAAPNFAFELCVKKARDQELAGLDLSSWRCALNGAEPVNAGTLDRFAQRFGPYGFRREALMPVYGLAECSVALSFPPRGRAPLIDRVEREPFETDGHALVARADDSTALSFVSVGRALPGYEIRVLDGASREAPDRTVGRIVFRGPSSMREYYRNPAATAAVMLAGGWIDTGDLGYRSGAELFVTGRLKDVIIKAGRNLVPQEIEDVAASVDGVRKGCVVAFGVADEASGTERLVILAESRSRGGADHDRIERAIRTQVATAVGVPPDTVVILQPGAVPKTPSGKIRRGASRTLYLEGGWSAHERGALALKARLVALAVPRTLRAAGRSTRRALYAAYLGAASALASVTLGPPIVVLLHALPAGRPVRVLSRIAARLLFAITGCRLAVRGRERLPRGGSMVLVSNHASYADIPALIAALPTSVTIVTMQEIDQWRFVGTFVRRGKHPTVDRWRAQQSVADSSAIAERVRAGGAVLFFPEGKLGTGDELGPLRLGAFETAIETGAAVVPVAIRGAHRVLRHGTRLPRPGPIEVTIGEPITPVGEGWRAVVDLRDRAAAALAVGLRAGG
jgi:1-acyl-sn-glycerol-3-phosphate acyltransferase